MILLLIKIIENEDCFVKIFFIFIIKNRYYDILLNERNVKLKDYYDIKKDRHFMLILPIILISIIIENKNDNGFKLKNELNYHINFPNS